MFGFPENVSDWTARDYLRLLTIVLVYLTVRPLLQGLYKKLGERQREREKKKADEEKIKEFKQQRVREKLGVDEPSEVKEESKSSTKKPVTTKSRKQAIEDDMPSDDDVSDLLN